MSNFHFHYLIDLTGCAFVTHPSHPWIGVEFEYNANHLDNDGNNTFTVYEIIWINKKQGEESKNKDRIRQRICMIKEFIKLTKEHGRKTLLEGDEYAVYFQAREACQSKELHVIPFTFQTFNLGDFVDMLDEQKNADELFPEETERIYISIEDLENNVVVKEIKKDLSLDLTNKIFLSELTCKNK